MRQSQSISHSQDIVHPTCPKCGAPMWLTRLEPDGPGSEQRTFEVSGVPKRGDRCRQMPVVRLGYASQLPLP